MRIYLVARLFWSIMSSVKIPLLAKFLLLGVHSARACGSMAEVDLSEGTKRRLLAFLYSVHQRRLFGQAAVRRASLEQKFVKSVNFNFH